MADLIDRDELLKNYGLASAVKYGNEDAEQQYRSYSTLMLYEVADMIREAPAVNRWIPCSESLPEAETRVLLCHKNGDIMIGELCDIKIFDTDNGFVKPEDITHWMPLPEPPEIEVQDERQ